MDSGDSDQRGFDGHADDGFGFFDGAANGTDREIEIHDLAFAPAFGFGGAQGRETHAAQFVEFADQRAGLGAADIEGHDVAFFLRQIADSLLLDSRFDATTNQILQLTKELSARAARIFLWTRNAPASVQQRRARRDSAGLRFAPARCGRD